MDDEDRILFDDAAMDAVKTLKRLGYPAADVVKVMGLLDRDPAYLWTAQNNAALDKGGSNA